MIRYAILKDKKIVPVDDVLEWAKWFEDSAERFIATDKVGDVKVSTIFLGVNHGIVEQAMGTIEGGLWFETMIFGGEHDGWQDRYTTYNEAEAGHKRAVEMVNASK